MNVTKPVRVGFDPHGGDPDKDGTSPLVRNIAGLATVSREYAGKPVTFKVTGRQDEIQAELAKHDHANNIKLVHVPEVFAMDGKLGDYKGKTTAISKLAEMLKNGEVDVLFSNGNTTATVIYPTLKDGRISRGVMPSIVTQIPRGSDGFYFLADAGATKNAKPSHLFYNAIMAQLYLRHVKNIPHPRIGLLEGPLADEAEPRFRESMNAYVAIVTPDAVYDNKVDIVICGGFEGNVGHLKAVEATASGTIKRLKSWRSKGKMLFKSSREKLLLPYFARSINQLDTLEKTCEFVDVSDSESVEKKLGQYVTDLPKRKISNIAVLSNGGEAAKGNQLARDLSAKVSELSSTNKCINYVGFVEPEDVINGVVRRNGKKYSIDVVLAHPKVVNLFLDTVTSAERVFLDLLKPIFELKMKEWKPKFRELKQGLLNPNHYNGAPVLGIKYNVLVGHGKADQYGTEQGLRFAIDYFRSGFVERARSIKFN